VEIGVLSLFESIIFLLKELLRIPIDVLTGTKRRSYVLSRSVNAPKTISWSVVSAHKIKLEGTPPIELDTEPDPLRPRVFSGVCRVGDQALPFTYQVLDERPGEAIMLRLLINECDPVYRLGDDYVGAVAVSGDEQQSVITNRCELTHTKFSTRLIMPLTVLRGVQSLQRTAEARAGNDDRTPMDQVRTALLTGALTFASFFALFGGSLAASLLIVILLHELGHVIAMRWVGIPVRGIYFVPFFGGVAIGESLGATEATRGFVALMGPAFSMLTTLIWIFLSVQSGDQFISDLALISGLLNGFNLLPILPLDGGRVLQAMASRLAPGVARAVYALTFCIGIGLAIAFSDYLLLIILLLIAPSIFRSGPSDATKLRPLSNRELGWLTAGYVATIAFYIAATLKVWNEIPLPPV
jgi:Zn-dependent protease